MALSTTAAGTMSHTARGLSSFCTSSASERRAGGLLRHEIGHRRRRPVEHDAIVAVANQAPDHVGAHPAESDHSELHQRPLIFR